MKALLFILLIPVFGYSQAWVEPQPKIELLRIEVVKDTLFVYRFVRLEPHSLSVNREWVEYNDREVYVIRNNAIILLGAQRPKTRVIKVEKVEEYW